MKHAARHATSPEFTPSHCRYAMFVLHDAYTDENMPFTTFLFYDTLFVGVVICLSPLFTIIIYDVMTSDNTTTPCALFVYYVII